MLVIVLAVRILGRKVVSSFDNFLNRNRPRAVSRLLCWLLREEVRELIAVDGLACLLHLKTIIGQLEKPDAFGR